MKQYSIERFSNGYLVVRGDQMVTFGVVVGGGGGGNYSREAFFFSTAQEFADWITKDLGGGGCGAVYTPMGQGGGGR